MGLVRTIIRKAGAIIGVRKTINLIEGTNVTLTVADDPANDRVNVTINSSGGGGGGLTEADTRRTSYLNQL